MKVLSRLNYLRCAVTIILITFAPPIFCKLKIPVIEYEIVQSINISLNTDYKIIRISLAFSLS